MAVGSLMEHAVREATKAAFDLESTERLLDAGPEILKAAVQDIAPIARGQLLAVFGSSGLHSRSGRLASAVGRATVSLTRKGIRISLPPGMGDKFYMYAAAQNYGSLTRGVPQREFLKVNKAELKGRFIKAANSRIKQRAKAHG